MNDQLSNFGKRLAMLRKAAGYTQQQLADEIGATRRMIAYYESESQHPPANMLVDLVKALTISADELLGIKPSQATPVGSRLERRIKKMETLGPKPSNSNNKSIRLSLGRKGVSYGTNRQFAYREVTGRRLSSNV